MLNRCFFSAFLLYLTNQCFASSLKEVYELAIANDPELAAAEASFKAQEEIIVQRRAALLPSVSVGGGSTVGERWILSNDIPSEPSGSHGWSASLSQPIFRIDSWYRFRQGKDLKAQAAANFAIAQQELIVRVTDSYLTILESQAALTSAKAERDAVKRQLDQVQQRFDVGLVAITDVLEAQAAYDSSIVAVIEREGAQSISFEALLRITGKTITEVSGIIEDMPITSPNPGSVEDWIERALTNNFRLKAAKEGLRASEKDVQIARSGHLPTINASAVWSHNVTEGRTFLGSKTNTRSYSINVNLPLYQGGQVRSASRQAVFNLASAQENFDYLQRTTVENTRNLFTAIKTDVARVRARERSIESSQSALDATKTGYEVGTRNIVEVLQAQRQLYLAQFQYASARYQYIRDNIRLKEIVGNLSPADVYSLDQFVEVESTIKRLSQ